MYITEWGWDSDGAGENCVGDQYHSVCVSAFEQVSKIQNEKNKKKKNRILKK